jgi:hypothetical protein
MQIQIDMTDVLKLAEQLKVTQDQVPYAMTRALNEATQVTRTYLIKETWPGSGIKVRNASFIAASLTTKDTRATKFYLESEIYDKLGRGHLYEQAKGGVRSPRGRSHLAIPSSNVPRTARGIPKGLKPLALRGKDTRIGDQDLWFWRIKWASSVDVHLEVADKDPQARAVR